MPCMYTLCKDAHLRIFRASRFLQCLGALACVVQLLGCCLLHQRVIGSIPGQGTFLGCRLNSQEGRWGCGGRAGCWRLLINDVHLSLSLPLSLKIQQKDLLFRESETKPKALIELFSGKSS